MILTVAAFKGGVGKTTSAVHLATFLQEQQPTLLVDGDPNRSATNWSKRETCCSSDGWPADEVPAEVDEDTILGRLLTLNQERAGALG